MTIVNDIITLQMRLVELSSQSLEQSLLRDVDVFANKCLISIVSQMKPSDLENSELAKHQAIFGEIDASIRLNNGPLLKIQLAKYQSLLISALMPNLYKDKYASFMPRYAQIGIGAKNTFQSNTPNKGKQMIELISMLQHDIGTLKPMLIEEYKNMHDRTELLARVSILSFESIIQRLSSLSDDISTIESVLLSQAQINDAFLRAAQNTLNQVVLMFDELIKNIDSLIHTSVGISTNDLDNFNIPPIMDQVLNDMTQMSQSKGGVVPLSLFESIRKLIQRSIFLYPELLNSTTLVNVMKNIKTPAGREKPNLIDILRKTAPFMMHGLKVIFKPILKEGVFNAIIMSLPEKGIFSKEGFIIHEVYEQQFGNLHYIAQLHELRKNTSGAYHTIFGNQKSDHTSDTNSADAQHAASSGVNLKKQ